MKGSLRNKIIAWSFFPTAIILAIVAVVSLYAYQRVTENLVMERDRELTHLSAKLLANDLAAYTDPLTDLFLTAFDSVIVFDEEGAVLAAEPARYEKRELGWLKRFVQNQERLRGAPFFSDIINGGFPGEDYVVVLMSTTGRQGRSAGGTAGLFRLGPTSDSALYRSVAKLRRAESKCIYLVDGSGHVIYHSNAAYIGEDFSGHPVVKKALGETSGAYRTQDQDGEEIVASFAPVPGTSWGLISEESWAGLTAYSRRVGHTLLVLLSLGIVVPMTIVTLGVRRITQPIADLIGAAEEIAGGRFGRRIESSSGDELEELAEQFNLMAAQLQESYTHLERKVADRTRELATLNAIAAEVSQSLDLEEILDNALGEVLAVMDMESGQAFRLARETEMLMSVVHRGLSEEYLQHTARLPLRASLVGEAVQAGRLAVHAVDDFPQGRLKELAAAEGLQLAICVPLMVHGKSVGALNLGTRRPRVVSVEEMSLLAAIGHQIGVAVENAQLYEQAQQLAVMKERNRLARDLHDSVTQAMYGVTLYAEAAARQLVLGDRELATRHLSEIQETAQESLCEMRLLVFELRLPMLRQEGLTSALQARLEAVESRVGLETQFEANVEGRLSPEIEEGLYRIAQEALNNALRHAHAQRVTVQLRQNGKSVTLEVIDDGAGFDPTAAREQGGFGLRSMEERAARLGAELNVESSPGQGSKVSVEVSR